jgi:peptide-methionine (S)-S-oxide reductase
MSAHTRVSTPFALGVAAVAALLAGCLPHAHAAPPVLPDPEVDLPPASSGTDSAVFAGGCFWGVDAVFRHVKGVRSVESGYAGGHTMNPTYEEVSSGTTGHAESVRVVYDPAQVSYGRLLKVFMSVAHDPTELNRQGPDVGTQYRSIVFTSSAAQKRTAEAYLEQLTAARSYPRPIVTQLVPLAHFYPAEGYHQDYLAHHPDQPYIIYNDLPKLGHLQATFPELYRP